MSTTQEKFYDLVKEIKIAMMTTRAPGGHMLSRPMATQKRASGADLWFVSLSESEKVRDINFDPHVNLAYFKPGSMEWISVSGLAKLSGDRNKISELYEPDWKMWFPEEGDPRHGTPDDPRMALIGVDIQSAEFMEVNKPKPVILFELVKGWITGSEPDIGEMHTLKRAGG